MKKIIMITSVMIYLPMAHSVSGQYQSAEENNPHFIQQRWHLKSQYFASHDRTGTDLDTIKCAGSDYLFFDTNNRAYCYFNGLYDTLDYKLIGTDSISFGDTPFSIRKASSRRIELYQNEEEKNGDYNRIIITLEK